jgi:Homeodomain-like domain
VAGKEIAVKKYVVRLDAEERDRLNELIRKGKRSAQLLTKARILLKADVSDAGEGWSDSRIAAALDTSIATVERTRRQLVEEGFEAVLARKYNANSARRRIAWQDHRNKHHAKADWQFTTANARVKLKRLYPQFE